MTLREAAQDVLDRWDSPQWEWAKQGPTADLMAALRAALEQPEPPHEAQSDAEKLAYAAGWWAAMEAKAKEQPAYTHPPRRKWRRLTDAQIAEIYMDCALVTPSDIYFARAIEAALKARNR